MKKMMTFLAAVISLTAAMTAVSYADTPAPAADPAPAVDLAPAVDPAAAAEEPALISPAPVPGNETESKFMTKYTVRFGETEYDVRNLAHMPMSELTEKGLGRPALKKAASLVKDDGDYAGWYEILSWRSFHTEAAYEKKAADYITANLDLVNDENEEGFVSAGTSYFRYIGSIDGYELFLTCPVYIDASGEGYESDSIFCVIFKNRQPVGGIDIGRDEPRNGLDASWDKGFKASFRLWRIKSSGIGDETAAAADTGEFYIPQFGLTVTLPSHWSNIGMYAYNEEETSFAFYSKTMREAVCEWIGADPDEINPGDGGVLFYIVRLDEPMTEKEFLEKGADYTAYRYIAATDCTYVLYYASDVQCTMEDADQYGILRDEVVLVTFSLDV